MKVVYEALDQSGNVICDSIEAVTIADAREQLRQRGLSVTSTSEDSGRSSMSLIRTTTRRGRGGRLKKLAVFSRQLAVLVRTGTPLT